jgi:hypothetical protein
MHPPQLEPVDLGRRRRRVDAEIERIYAGYQVDLGGSG